MIRDFINELGIEFYEAVSLKKYNTYRLETVARYLVFPDNRDNLRELVMFLERENVKYIVLGNGSNIILANDYYDGVVILLSKFKNLKINGNVVEVEAGYSLSKLGIETASMGLSGLEFAAGIPGFVGASIAMNAGAYNSSMESVVDSVVVLDPDFNYVEIKNEDMDFEYRSTMFKKRLGYIIISAVIKLEYGKKEELMEKINNRREKRFVSQPLEFPSAGSVFRNPEGMHAGELIEKCGLKGYSVNGAMVSSKHANFIVNSGNASGSDIVVLIGRIKSDVKEKFGVDLVLEQIIVD